MKSTARLMTPQAARFAAFALALTAVLGMPASAKSIDSRTENASASAVNRSAPARSAAKTSAPARTNTARPAQTAARPTAARSNASAARPAAASRPASARPNTARTNTARTNTARPNSAKPSTARGNSRPDTRRSNTGRDDHRSVARGDRGGHGDARGDRHGEARGDRHDFRNASYSHGHGENLHGGRQIPDDRFRASFGSGHQFHIGHPTMIGGQASFSFGGFWFGIVDPWPAAWLYSDPVYVDFVDGGYVLVNVAHPGVEVALSAGDPAPATCAAPDSDAPAPAAPVATVTPVAPVTVAYAVPFYSYFTWHYWRPYWHHYWR